jgi:Domain of unknown function (DUF4403)
VEGNTQYEALTHRGNHDFVNSRAAVHTLHKTFSHRDVEAQGDAMNTLIRTISLMLVPALTLIGCSHTIPPASTALQPPPELGKAPPRITPLNAADKRAQAPESMLPIHFTADFTPIQRTIQDTIPERFTDEEQPFTNPFVSDYRWRFIREGEPEVSIQDDIVKYRAVYRGEIESVATRACRLDPLFPILEGTGRLVLREQDQKLLVTTRDVRGSVELKPESDSKCNMFNIAVKDQLAELFRQEAINQQIGQSVERAGYAIPLQFVWERLQEPMTVGQADNQLCLYGKARDFNFGPLKGTAQQTTIVGVARQTPVALYQTPCQKPAVTPLKVHMDNMAAAEQTGQSYKILLTVPVPYAVLNRQLQDTLFHREAKLPATLGSNTLTIERATASDVEGRSLLTVETSGDVNGFLYFWGTPRLEQDGNVIVFPDLQMANETKMALDDVKSGYWQMVNGELQPRLRQAATIDLAPRIRDMKSALNGQHQAGLLAVDVSLERQEARQITSTKEALVADIMLEGTASATGRLSVKQQIQNDTSTNGTSLKKTPGDSAPPKAAGIPKDSASDDSPEFH